MENMEMFREDFYYDESKSVFALKLPHPVFRDGVDAVLCGELSGTALACFGLLGVLYGLETQHQTRLSNIGLAIQNPEVLEKHERRVRELLAAAVKAHNVGNFIERDKCIKEVEDITCSDSH